MNRVKRFVAKVGHITPYKREEGARTDNHLEEQVQQKRTPKGRAAGLKARRRKNFVRHEGKDPSLRAGTKAADYAKAGENGVQKITARHRAMQNGD